MTEDSSRAAPGGTDRFRRRLAALLEVAGVFVAGHTVASYLGSWIGIEPLRPMLESSFEEERPDLVPISLALGKILLVQYGCLLSLAFVIRWWHRRRTAVDYGLTTAGQPLAHLVGVGLLACCLVVLPFKVLWIVQQHVSLGPGSFWWILFSREWNPTFWLFFAVGSFALVPVVEELFFRGYCQSRLEEDFGGGASIVVAALFFVFTHRQYHQASILSIASIACLVMVALGLGYVYWKTRSLVPCIVLHAVLNFPTKGVFDYLLPAAMVLALVILHRRWSESCRDFVKLAGGQIGRASWAACVAIAVAVGFQRWHDVVLPLALAGLAVALFLEYRERRSRGAGDERTAAS